MEVLKKIQKAIKEIKETKVKKEGRNDYSKYDYFEPSQIDLLVFKACHKLGLNNKFDMIRNEFGIYGQMTVTDIETNDKEVYYMASDIPSIKATNISQQLGGAQTYTKRYMLQNIYEITDNNLDFDTSSNTAVSAQKKNLTVKAYNYTMEKGTAADIQKVLDEYDMTKQQRKDMETLMTDKIIQNENN